jgi:hypothetical protein
MIRLIAAFCNSLPEHKLSGFLGTACTDFDEKGTNYFCTSDD